MLDGDLLEEATRLSGERTYSRTVDRALADFVKRIKARRILDLAGSGGPTPPVRGSFDVRELFTEVQIPIVSHSFIEELTLTGGFRYSDYKVADNHFSTNTYKIAGEFAPVRDIRARASYNRAVRAPNIVELFGPTSLGLAGGTDPCAGSSPPGAGCVGGESVST